MGLRSLSFFVLLGLTAGQIPSDYDDPDWGTKACGLQTTPTTTNDAGCCCATMARDNGLSECTQTEKVLCKTVRYSKASDEKCDKTFGDYRADGNQIWMILAGALVVFMQCGFAMLEAGSVRSRNTSNIIFKNMIDACLASLVWWAVGYGFAYGKTADHMIGTNNFFLIAEADDESGMAGYFFQFAFAATASTIVSGAVAERTKTMAYFIYAVVLTGFIYPVVVHWVWSNDGWLSAFAPANVRLGPNGMIDFAGSGVVHAVGGFAGLVGTIVLGPRFGRFEESEEEELRVRQEIKKAVEKHWIQDQIASGKTRIEVRNEIMMSGGLDADEAEKQMEVEEEACCSPATNHRGWCKMSMYGVPTSMQGQSMMLSALGVLILWFGWYGFNAGSTLALDGRNAGKVATTTTLSAAAGGLIAVLIARLPLVGTGKWEVGYGLNGVLGGLVSITAGCSVVHEYYAIAIGAIGGVVYYGASNLLLYLRIDDPLDAWPVHGACGVWGVIAVGIFAQAENLDRAYGGLDNKAVNAGSQFWTQVAGITSIVVWTVATCLPLFYLIDTFIGMRVPHYVEDLGLDAEEHGMNPQRSFIVRHGYNPGMESKPREASTEPAAAS